MDKTMKKLGIVGLGLIGGSLAKAFARLGQYEILGADTSEPILAQAKSCGAIQDILTDSRLAECDILLLALYPQAAIDYVAAHADRIREGTVVIDCCGVKRKVCDALFPLAASHGFFYIGGHPMAGTERSGFDYATPDLFCGASMILTPPENITAEILKQAEKIFLAVGFGSIKYATPEEHDRIIAYTSQLAHVLSSAYVKSPAALLHRGFSAGSFRDMTRVARLNETMWTELFLENHEYLAEEVEGLAHRLEEYAAAIREKDAGTLFSLLKEGRERKMIVEGEEL